MLKESRLFISTAAALTALATGGLALAQTQTSGHTDSTERDLMTKAAQSNIAEIQEGRLAMTQSTNPQIQALGNRLVQDHSKAQDTLAALAAKMSVNLPANPASSEEQQIARLEGLKGSAFDKAFAPEEAKSHQKVIGEVQQAQGKIHNPALQAWIQENIPVLQEHLALARSVSDTSGSDETAKAMSSGLHRWGPPQSNVNAHPAPPGSPDTELMSKSMEGNLAEVELGRLALTHSTSPMVQGLATRLAQDGSKGVATLQAVAGMLHVELPSKPDSTQRGQISALSKLDRGQFDARFEKIALQDEEQFLRAFQAGVSAAHNAAVKSTLSDMVPVVQEHIEIAQAIPGQYPHRSAAAAEGAARNVKRPNPVGL